MHFMLSLQDVWRLMHTRYSFVNKPVLISRLEVMHVCNP